MMSRTLLLSGLVAMLMACSLAKPLEEQEGYTKTKVPQIKKVEFNGEILEIAVEEVDPFHRPIPADEGFSPNAYETDMMLNPEQEAALSDPKNSRNKRKAIKDTTMYWPKKIINSATGQHVITVPYEFNTGVDQTAIKAAMAHWQDQTCVRFETHNPSVPSQDRLTFIKDNGCYSYIGRQSGSQPVSIGDGCTQLGTVSHEIGHALGFNHEQSRPDRDEYVIVNFDNIKTDYKNNFDKRTTNDAMTNVPYDYSSAMHYGLYGFGIDAKVPTLIPKDPLCMKDIGQRLRLSYLDVKLANFMYQCDSHCAGASSCHTGYRDMNCKCLCPESHTGDYCEIARNVQAADRVTLTSRSGEVSSPNFDGSTDYAVDTSFMTYIKGNPNEQIRLKFDAFDMEAFDTSRNKCWDYVNVRAGSSLYSEGTDYCGNTLPKEIVADEIVLSFYSDKSVAKKGFHGTFTRESISGGAITCPVQKKTCTGTITLAAGCTAQITSPSYPSQYPIDSKCTYTINSPNNQIELAFDNFNTEQKYDTVKVTTDAGVSR
ncbi:blastula protease 10 [Strongylocentrotus purpuratus]|uniref:Metalloendopeptidase n=1 Tax=Strongylocentrotus purpuratus TaxID=7668 RepID=A0A7M7P2M1_STRPU|nr:blastula protease 10 [Strongylocentrotus purpuratus]